jgi:protein involved in polysaccharide export with SLBB domain
MTRSGINYGFAVPLFVVFGVVGCATHSGLEKGDPIAIIEGTSAGKDTSYRLQVGDGIAVHFFSFPDLDDTATIGPDGRVSLRLVGDFPIAGMTLAEAAGAANEHFEEVLKHPGVTINIKTYALQQVFVSGAVNNPGVIRSAIPLTATGAIAQAGGVKLPSAQSDGAILLRRKPDGKVVYYKLAFHGNLPGSDGDPILRTNDLVYVPRTAIASVADFIQGNITRIIPINATYSLYHSY